MFSNITSKGVPLSKRIIALTLAVWLTSSVAIAQPGGKGGGNKAKPYRLVVLDTESGVVESMTETYLVSQGNTTVTQVDAVGSTSGMPRHWRVTQAGTVSGTWLQLPADTDFNSSGQVARATNINNFGNIVGEYRVADNGGWLPLVWEDQLSEPLVLPLPVAFVGRATPQAINNSGLIVGTIRGHFNLSGEIIPLDGLVAWQTYWGAGEHAILQVSSPGWFDVGVIAHFGCRLNDSGWIQYPIGSMAYRAQLQHEWIPISETEWASQFTWTSPPAQLFAATNEVKAGGINQAGDAAGSFGLIGQSGRDVFARTLSGTLRSFPKVIDNRQTGTYANNIADINDATSAHRVQIIGKAGTYSKGSGSLFLGNWAIWEENASSVVLLKDVTDVPTDSSYDFTATTEFNSINDSSWIGGGIARGPDRVRVPAILIRQ